MRFPLTYGSPLILIINPFRNLFHKKIRNTNYYHWIIASKRIIFNFVHRCRKEEECLMMKNLHPHLYQITLDDRITLMGHRPGLIWFTGLSASGKSTIADYLAMHLHNLGLHTYNLDGDTLRSGLNKDLGFSDEDRSENLRRVAEVAKILIDSGAIVLAAFISPFSQDRALIRQITGPENYMEVFVNTPIEVCENRDTKGLYKKARKGEIKHFTGIDSPYEIPENPDLVINTLDTPPEHAAAVIAAYFLAKKKS